MTDRTDSIVYDEGFVPVSEKTVDVAKEVALIDKSIKDSNKNFSENKNNDKKRNTQILLTIQLILCLLIILFLLVTKYAFPDFFSYLSEQYEYYLNDSIIAEDVFAEIDFTSVEDFLNGI